MADKLTFKQKVLRVLGVFGGIIAAFLAGILANYITKPKISSDEAKKNVDDSINTAKTDAENLQANVDVLNTAVENAKKAATTDTTDDRLKNLEAGGVITRKPKS